MKNTIISVIILLCYFQVLPLNAQQSGSDIINTGKGPITVHPIHHATFAMDWDDKTIYVDPTGDGKAFAGMGAPDLIFITHAHGDHLSPKTLQAINTKNATLIMPQSVAEKLSKTYGKKRVIMANGDDTKLDDISIYAMPMYNLPESDDAYHPKGWGNGYVLTLGGKKVYISGDTEGIPEMRSLKNIDLAFVCMNLPYTMNVEQAAGAVLDFKPKIVYPYHYRGQDVQKFKQLVNAKNDEIEIRLRDWYK